MGESDCGVAEVSTEASGDMDSDSVATPDSSSLATLCRDVISAVTQGKRVSLRRDEFDALLADATRALREMAGLRSSRAGRVVDVFNDALGLSS